MEKGRTPGEMFCCWRKSENRRRNLSQNAVDFAYNSKPHRGSQLSHEQTRYIFETHSIDGTAFVDDVIETANHFQ